MSSSPLPYGVAPLAFRLPEAAHVGGVHLLVSDLARSVEYYERVIGLRAGPSSLGNRVPLFPGADARPLVTLHTRTGVTAARQGAFGLYHFAILLPDRAALGRFAAHARRLGVRLGMADHLVSEALYLHDPDGLGIEVYADRPRNTWQRQGQELKLVSDPLDLANVIAAGGHESWTGAPTGTTMGHVHLHVGDLNAAEGFYHRGLGLDKISWSYPGALFLSAGGYHHHLGLNTWAPGPSAASDEAQLIEWELLVPSDEDVAAAAESLRAAGGAPDHKGNTLTAVDPWGTTLRVAIGA